VPVFVCNHCGEVVKNNGGSCREVGMIEVEFLETAMVGQDVDNVVAKLYYHYGCARCIAVELLEEI